MVLSGCGYKPLYGTDSSGRGVAETLSSIAVAEPETRIGQLVRNNIVSSIRPAGSAGQDRYKLTLNSTLSQSTLIDKAAPGIQRRRLRLAVSYELIELSSGSAVNSGKTFSNVSYDIVHQPIADLQAETNATEKAAQEVGQDIRSRLAAFISSR